jgi:cell fate (sporulation/competence/biofilm development) regulator YlbF (YheA/YmcA/DUF963 family)
MWNKKAAEPKLNPKAQAFVNSFAKIQEAIDELAASGVEADSIINNELTTKFSAELKNAVMKHVLAARLGLPAIANLSSIQGASIDQRRPAKI